MTKAECKERLLNGETMDSIFRFTPGQECLIFKADRLSRGDEIIYIPDIDLNSIPVDADLSADPENLSKAISCCYTGNDFMELCNDDAELADLLFAYCDWQHPSSAIVDLEIELSEDDL